MINTFLRENYNKNSIKLWAEFMDKPVEWEQTRLMKELNQGLQLAKQLRCNLRPSSSSETRNSLLHGILSSYDKAIELLNSRSIVDLPQSFSGGSDGSDPDASRDTCHKNLIRKRKSLPQWTQQVRLNGNNSETTLEDGYNWRKYGQKDILGSNFPRGYYRCSHRHVQGCLATKQVQRSDHDPSVLEITYRGRHTCSPASDISPPPLLPPPPLPLPAPASFTSRKSMAAVHSALKKEEKTRESPPKMSGFPFPPYLLSPEMENGESYRFSQSPAGGFPVAFIPPPPAAESGYLQMPPPPPPQPGFPVDPVPGSRIGALDFSLSSLDLDPKFSIDVVDLFS